MAHAKNLLEIGAHAIGKSSYAAQLWNKNNQLIGIGILSLVTVLGHKQRLLMVPNAYVVFLKKEK